MKRRQRAEPAEGDCKPLISVVVCTYNRADLLAHALRDLCDQTLARSLYEIVVVDNNSSDTTKTVVERFAACAHVAYEFESNQGLSHARNRGWRVARGEYVGYVDDDCRIPPEWLALARELIERTRPSVLGGPYYACYDSRKPAWFQDRYGSHVLEGEARPLLPDEYLTGGNIFFRRSLLEALGGFDTKLGVSGATMTRGEETALLRRIRNEMAREVIYYAPALYLFHLVHEERMKVGWSVRSRFADGRSSYLVFVGATSSSRPRILTAARAALVLLELSLDLARSVVWRDKARYPYVQNYLYERVLQHVGRLGGLYEQLRSSGLALVLPIVIKALNTSKVA